MKQVWLLSVLLFLSCNFLEDVEVPPPDSTQGIVVRKKIDALAARIYLLVDLTLDSKYDTVKEKDGMNRMLMSAIYGVTVRARTLVQDDLFYTNSSINLRGPGTEGLPNDLLPIKTGVLPCQYCR